MLLFAEHLSIHFGSRQPLNDVNFYLNEGGKTGINASAVPGKEAEILLQGAAGA